MLSILSLALTFQNRVDKPTIMSFKERVPTALFKEDGHYLGRPADFDDKIITRRLNLVKAIPNFVGKDLTLLDIGCGNGASMLTLAPQMKSCHGVEVSSEHQAGFEKHKEAMGIQNCSYQVADISKTNLKTSYDRIISFEVIEHLEDENHVEFYYNHLNSGGIMAISVPNKWWIFETHGAKLPLLPWNRVPFFSWLPRPIHERYANARIYTTKRIKSLLEKHGFKILSTAYITAPMDVLPKGKFKDVVVKSFFEKDTTKLPFKSTSIFVVAEKP